MFLHQVGEGFLEPAASRYLIDYGGYAEVLIDGTRRIAQATKTETVELWDFGVPVDSLGWSRLPSFRTPR